MNDLVNKLSMMGLFIIFFLLVIGGSVVASFILVQDDDDSDFRFPIRWIVASLFGGGMVVVCLHVKGYI